MSERTIAIDGTQTDQQWIGLINRHRWKPDEDSKRLVVGIKSPFIEPYQIVSLACLIEEYYLHGIPVCFTRNPSLANEYLEYVRFFEYWETGYDRNAFTNSGKKTTLALWKISLPMISTYADQSKRYFESLYFTDKDLSALHIALTETFNNIFDHAKSAVEGFVLTQYYPRVRALNIAICDFGNGIPDTLEVLWKKRNKPRPTDEELLHSAFKSWITTKSTVQNRGYGLANLLGSIRNVRGRLNVTSNKGSIEFWNNTFKVSQCSESFQGTLIQVSFDPKNLPLREAEFDNEEFFF